MKIGQKLALGFFVAVLCVWATVFFANYTYSKIHKEFELLKEDIIPGAIAMAEINGVATEIAHWLMDHMVHGEEEYAEKIQLAMEGIKKQGLVHLEHETHIGQEEQKVAKELVSKIQGFAAAAKKIIDMKKQEVSLDELIKREDKIFHPAMTILSQQLNEHKAVHMKELAEAEEAVHKAHLSGVRFLLLSAFIITLFAVAISFFITRSIAKPIHALHKGTEIIGKGNLDYKVATDSMDEIGQLSRAFDKMTDELKETTVSREYVENIIKSMIDSLVVVTPEGTIQMVNQATCEMLGYQPEELIEQPIVKIFIEEEMQKLFQGTGLQELIKRGFIKGIEKIYLTKDGNKIPVLFSGSVMHNSDGRIQGIICLASDISERKQMQEELLKAKKLESVGILAGGIAHDFNNFLSVILGNIELAKDDIKPEVGISECLAEAEKASIQAQALTKQLITFAKGGAPVKKIGSIGNLVKETTDYSLSGSNVKCDFLISHDLWPVEFDEGQMKHAIKNMIDNAVESMPDEGTIHVRAENFNITAEQGLPLLEGKYVKISIRDHGVGIPEKHLSKIFDPYFSTKEMGIQKGMGLGLATTYSIINRHDGHITVESEVGVGTTFTLFLPAHEKEIRELKPLKTHKPEKPSIRTGRILVMDDEESIRKLSKKRLSQLGYESELAKDGAQAIELYKKAMDSGQPFDAVILDLTVKGGMGGKDAVKALLKINPQVKAMVSSGYSNDPVMTDFRAHGFTGALPKPNTKKELIAALKNITKE